MIGGDPEKNLRELTAQLARIEAKCRGIQRFNPEHLTTTHYQCERQREDIGGLIAFWQEKQANGVPA